MKVHLAGYNIDAELIKQMKILHKDLSDQFTPETISAAYARISRDPRQVNELREIASKEVEKARKSNNAIIFDLGHSSVAEHAVFNLDIIGISRLAIEELEHFRLASYTEKSQRYITLTDDFVIPEEINDVIDIEKFKNIIKLQNNFYHELFEKLKVYVFQENKNLSLDTKNHRLLEGFAKEDARYISSLATQGQLGMTLNARTLELILRRLNSSKLKEVNTLSKAIYDELKDIAPSVVKYTKATEYDLTKYDNISKFVNKLSLEVSQSQSQSKIAEDVKLVKFTKDADDLIISAILHTVTGYTFDEVQTIVKSMDTKTKQNILVESFKDIKLYDVVLREFEYADFIFELNISAACFGQLKRHRMITLTNKNYNLDLGVIIPDSIIKIGYKEKFLEIISRTNEVYNDLFKKYGNIAEYVLTNAHKRTVLVKINARELYHLSRLREDAHAQWDIRNISSKIVELAREVAPITTFLTCGKDTFIETYKNIIRKEEF